MNDVTERVKKYKRRLKSDGYRNVAFLVSPTEFKQIKKAKKHYNLGIKDLFMYFVSGQYKIDFAKDNVSFGDDDEDQGVPFGTPEEREAAMEKDESNGEATRFENKKSFVLAYTIRRAAKFPSKNPYDVEFIKDFDSYNEAVEHYMRNKLRPKTVTLYARVSEEMKVEPYWYWARMSWASSDKRKE